MARSRWPAAMSARCWSTRRAGRSSLALPLAFVASALIGALFERALYRHLYARSHLDQVLFSIGLVFMSVAAVDYIMGSSRIFIKLPAALEGQFDLFGVGIGRYRLMIIVICGLLTAGAATGAGANAIWQPAARGGRRSARRQRARHQRAAGVRLYLRVRLRPCRPRRRAERGDPRARSVFPAEIHDLLPDRGDGRRLLQHHRAVPGVAAARHRRRRRQILRAQDGAVRDLHHHDRDPDLASRTACSAAPPRVERGR